MNDLRAALKAIVEFEPEWTAPVIDNADCAECAANRKRNWPPSGLCDTHYRVLSSNERANADRRNSQWLDMKAIARAALAATPEPTLDAAWAEAEAALPDGWSFWEITGYSPDEDHPKTRVYGRVRLANVIDRQGNVPEVLGNGPTPAAALRALAARLHERTEP